MAEQKTMENKQPIEAEGKVVEEKAKKEKFLAKAGKGLKKVVTSKPVKIVGRALLVAGSALGTVAFIRSGNSDSPALDMLDAPAFPDTQMAEIPTMESADETTE
jgi:hypothetical protein